MKRLRRDTESPVEPSSGEGGVGMLDLPYGIAAYTPAPKQSRWQAVLQFELTPKKIKRKELMHFSRQLAVFIRAGIPIIEGLETIAAEVKNKLFRQVLDSLIADLKGGMTFTAGLESHAQAFPPYYLGIIRSAELTGGLDDALDRLADYIERDIEARQKIVQALTYPMIVGAMAIVVVVVLVSYVLPRFKHFFKDLNAKLPLPTRMLLAIADFVHKYWYGFAGLILLLVVLGVWTTQSPRGRRILDRTVLRIPVLGDLVRAAVIERFCRILSSLVSAGVSLPESLAVTAQATTNVVYRDGINEAREAMMHGEGLASPLAATQLFPPAARQMLFVGEATGTMDKQLSTAATYYERELDYKIKRFTSLFEPAVILLVGLVVGFVAVSLVSAMYGIFHQVNP
jgi:type IV pilus assembly protein PilC